MSGETFSIPARWWAWSWKAMRRFAATDEGRLVLCAVAYSRICEGDPRDLPWQAHATDSYRLAVTRSTSCSTLPDTLHGPPTVVLLDEVGTLDLLARRILHRTRRSMKQHGVGGEVTFTVTGKAKGDVRPAIAEWDGVGVTCSVVESRYPNAATIWDAAVKREATSEELVEPLALDAEFLGDFARVPRSQGSLRSPHVVLVKRAGQMHPVLWRVVGAEWPVWALQMPVRAS